MKHIIAMVLAAAFVGPAHATGPSETIDPCGCLEILETLMPFVPPSFDPSADFDVCSSASYQRVPPEAAAFQHSVQTPQGNVNVQIAQGSGVVQVNRQPDPAKCP